MQRATFNVIGSVTRNSRKAGRYGFLADMRLRAESPAVQRHLDCGMCVGITYYGKEYSLIYCRPYIVIRDETSTARPILGIMPIFSQSILVDRHERRQGLVDCFHCVNMP